MQAETIAEIPPATADPAEMSEAEEKKELEAIEKSQPRRSTRISSSAKLPTEEGTSGRKGASAKKRAADETDEAGKTEENGAGSKKARGAKAKKPDESDEGLALGEPLPDLVVKSEKGDDVNVKKLADGHAGVVLFLIPKADTPGCTTQACGFRDIYPDFQGLNFKVYCLSADSPAAQTKWQTKKSLPYPLLSDPERVFIAVLTGSSSKTPRSHFVFADDKLVDKKMPVKPADSPQLALQFIKALDKSGEQAVEATTEISAVLEVAKDNTVAGDVSAAPDVKMDDTKEG